MDYRLLLYQTNIYVDITLLCYNWPSALVGQIYKPSIGS